MEGYIKIGDFEGESTDDGHVGWSRIQSVSAGLTRAMGGFSGSERGKGQTSLQDLSVVKELDDASVKLQKACATGERIAKVKVDLCATVSEAREPVLTYELEDVVITSYQFGHQMAQGDSVPTEVVTFNFNKVTWIYQSFRTSGKKRGRFRETYKIGENS